LPVVPFYRSTLLAARWCRFFPFNLFSLTTSVESQIDLQLRPSNCSHHVGSCVAPATSALSSMEIANTANTVRFLDLIKPFTPLLPEVAAPESKIPFNQKLMWTGVRETHMRSRDTRGLKLSARLTGPPLCSVPS
jgi:hypothetical protein